MNKFRIIAGSGRSGTTWVLDSIAKANNLRTIFEPLGPAKPSCSTGDFDYSYIDSRDDFPELNEYLKEIERGNCHSIWIDYRMPIERLYPTINSFSSKIKFKRYLKYWKELYQGYVKFNPALKNPNTITKFIRANLMLNWISRNFDARIILLLRHPAAVVESQLRLGIEQWDPYPKIEKYRNDSLLNDATLDRYKHLLNQSLTLAQAHTLNWCVENQIPLNDAESCGYTVIFYESLLDSSKREWHKLARGLDLENIPSQDAIAQASSQASLQWRKSSAQSQHSHAWFERVDKKTRNEISEILSTLNVTIYNTDSPFPIEDSELHISQQII